MRNTAFIQGDKANQLKALIAEKETATKALCQELGQVMQTFEQRFQELSERLEPGLEQIIAGTPLEGTPTDQVAFDIRYLNDHGVAVGHVKPQFNMSDIMGAILRGDIDALKGMGLHATEDYGGLRADPVDPTKSSDYVKSHWGQPVDADV